MSRAIRLAASVVDYSTEALAVFHSLVDSPTSISHNVAPMEIVLGLLADAANRSEEGKLNVLGAFTSITAHKFPARHPQMQLVLGLEASPAEVGMKKQLEVKGLDEDGHKVFGFGLEITVPPAATPGERVHMQLNLRLVDMIFPREGRYMIAILIDGNTGYEIPLRVGG